MPARAVPTRWARAMCTARPSFPARAPRHSMRRIARWQVAFSLIDLQGALFYGAFSPGNAVPYNGNAHQDHYGGHALPHPEENPRGGHRGLAQKPPYGD